MPQFFLCHSIPTQRTADQSVLRAGVASVGRGDAWGAAAVSHAADFMRAHGRPNVTVFQYRQIQVALRLFAQNAIAADNPANEHFFLHDVATKELCLAKQV